jgi:glutathione S-transferase
MNLLGRVSGVSTDDEPVATDLRRVQEIWTECREVWGKKAGGPYLFGHFTVADAMYAPVTTRFRTYGVKLSPVAQAYCDAMLADPDMMAWEEAARSEPPPEPKTD